MADAIQTELKVPDIDWGNYDTGARKTAPPQAKDAAGRYIQYFVQLPQNFPEESFGKTKEGWLKVNLDPLTMVNNGATVDGYQVRFASASAKQYQTRDGKTLQASQLGNLLESAGTAVMQPKDVDGYKAAVRAAAGAIIPVLIEWSAYDKTTRTEVRGKYEEFDGPTGDKSPVFKTTDGRTLLARAEIKSFVVPRAN